MRCIRCHRDDPTMLSDGICMNCIEEMYGTHVETNTVRFDQSTAYTPISQDDMLGASLYVLDDFINADTTTINDMIKEANKGRISTEKITLPRVEKLEDDKYELFKLDENNRITHKIISGTEDEIIKQLKESI